MAKRAGCAKAVLTHFYPDVDPQAARLLALREFGGEVQTSRDGSVHPLA
jgi:ribonuclease BN (tRNA processing enzyme)